MDETKEIIKSDESLKQKIKELIKQVMDEITTSAAAGSEKVLPVYQEFLLGFLKIKKVDQM